MVFAGPTPSFAMTASGSVGGVGVSFVDTGITPESDSAAACSDQDVYDPFNGRYCLDSENLHLHFHMRVGLFRMENRLVRTSFLMAISIFQ